MNVRPKVLLGGVVVVVMLVLVFVVVVYGHRNVFDVGHVGGSGTSSCFCLLPFFPLCSSIGLAVWALALGVGTSRAEVKVAKRQVQVCGCKHVLDEPDDSGALHAMFDRHGDVDDVTGVQGRDELVLVHLGRCGRTGSSGGGGTVGGRSGGEGRRGRGGRGGVNVHCVGRVGGGSGTCASTLAKDW